MTVAIIDYGVGNIGSLLNMFYRLEVDASVVTSPVDIRHHDHLLLPGVGAFDTAVGRLAHSGFDDAIREHVASGRHLLGICLGMQLLLDSSEEGTLPGLGLIRGRSVRFPSSSDLKVPHMGWSQVQPEKQHRLFTDLHSDHRFYFVHSYYVECENDDDVLGTTHYGVRYASMVAQQHVIGAQFHPEKSHRFGMRLLKNWVSL